MSNLGAAPGILTILILLGLVVAILWIILPFAVFGLKGLLKQAIEEQRKTNRQLGQIGQILEQALKDADKTRSTSPWPAEGSNGRPDIRAK